MDFFGRSSMAGMRASAEVCRERGGGLSSCLDRGSSLIFLGSLSVGGCMSSRVGYVGIDKNSSDLRAALARPI